MTDTPRPCAVFCCETVARDDAPYCGRCWGLLGPALQGDVRAKWLTGKRADALSDAEAILLMWPGAQIVDVRPRADLAEAAA